MTAAVRPVPSWFTQASPVGPLVMVDQFVVRIILAGSRRRGLLPGALFVKLPIIVG